MNEVMWTFRFLDKTHQEGVCSVLSSYTAAREKLNRYLSSSVHQHRVTYLKWVESKHVELVNELFETERDYYQLKLFKSIIAHPDHVDLQPLACMSAYVGLIFMGLRIPHEMRQRLDMREYGFLEADKELVETLRSRLEELHGDKDFHKAVDDFGCVDTVCDFVLRHASDREILYLADTDLDDVFLDFAEGRTTIEELNNPALLQPLEDRMQVLRREFDKSQILRKKLNAKVGSSLDTIFLEFDEGDFDILTTILMIFYRYDVQHQLSLITFKEKQEHCSKALNDPGLLAACAADPFFWFLSTFYLLRSNGGVVGESYADHVVDLFCSLMRSPSRIRRIKCPQYLDKLKARLSHFYSPFLRECQVEERSLDELNLSSLESTEHLNLFALNLLTLNNDLSVDGLSPGQFKAIKRLLKEIFYQSHTMILNELAALYCSDQSLDVLATFEDWIKEAEKEDLADEASAIEPAVDTIECTPERAWRYVHNPKAGRQQFDEIVFSEEDALDSYFRKNNIDSIIGTGSIIRAVDRFIQTEDNHKNLMIKEHTGDYSWHKVKRGKLRILLHEDKQGHIYVHIYPRKEWKYSAA